MGGKNKVIKTAQKALDAKEYAWGAQIIQYAYLLEPEDKKVRSLKAELLRQMAYRTNGSIARAFLMTEALTLEGKTDYPKLVPPSADTIAGSPETFVDYFRVRIDPRKSENTDKVVEFVLTDKGNHAVALHVRRGIAEYIPVPADYLQKSDYVLQMDSETWVELYLSSVSLKDAVDSGKVKLTGNEQEMVEVFDMFDKFKPTKNYMVPPIED
jgi:alkyl sulfatase BDS1-like metallo-beta-lactamase superfamily hydrolase